MMLDHRTRTDEVFIRPATDSDLPVVADIYAHYVLHSRATFEGTPPTAGEMARRRDALFAAGMPYLVAEIDGMVAGYAYAAPYRTRPAYRHTVEDSVYVAQEHHRRGVGAALLLALVDQCEKGPWHQMVAVIGDSANTGSVALHRRFGFDHVGTLRAVGFKLGQWVDTVLMQRALGPDSDTPAGDTSASNVEERP